MAFRHLLALLALLLIAATSFALECSSSVSRSMPVPAVDDLGAGRIVLLELTVKGGDGTVYIATDPIVGGMTQYSGHSAMELATKLAGYDSGTCDFLFKLDSKNLETIDGPSAGGAMALLVLSALKNESLIANFTMTGTIENDGTVGSVGGIPEKATAAGESGLGLFIVPNLGLEERIIVGAISKKYGLAVAQVSNISQVEAIATGASNFSTPPLERQRPPRVPGTSSLSGDRFLQFRKVAQELITRSKASIDSLSTSGGGYQEYFHGEIEVADAAFQNGYLYTGANTAFLAGINADFLASSGSASREEVDVRVRKVEECYGRVSGSKMYESNWEWVIGGQLRASWAKKKISGINNESFGNEIKTLGTLKDAVYAENWCRAAESLVSAQGSGAEIDPGKFKLIAAESIAAAEAYTTGRESELSDQAWHLEAAKQEFADGLYGAAVYDATYALYMSKGYDDFLRLTNAKEVLEFSKTMQYQSLWANIYKSQMEYLLANGDEGRTSLQLLEFADGLENRTYGMRSTFEKVAPAGPETEREPNQAIAVVVSLLILLTALAIVFVVKQAKEE